MMILMAMLWLHLAALVPDRSEVSHECVKSTLDWVRGEVGDTITVDTLDSLLSSEEVDDLVVDRIDPYDSTRHLDSIYWFVPFVAHTADTIILPKGCTQHLMIRLVEGDAGADSRSIDLVDTAKRVVMPLIVSVGDLDQYIRDEIIYERSTQTYFHVREEWRMDTLYLRTRKKLL